MIERGEKLEEYRSITDYWVRRLMICRRDFGDDWQSWEELVTLLPDPNNREYALKGLEADFQDFDAVRFSYGYSAKRCMTFECEGISIGVGRPEWGAPGHETFIIKLGKKLWKQRKRTLKSG